MQIIIFCTSLLIRDQDQYKIVVPLFAAPNIGTTILYLFSLHYLSLAFLKYKSGFFPKLLVLENCRIVFKIP